MAKDTPGPERSARERGTYARHGDAPTLASYLSTLFFLLSVPTAIALAYGGYWADLYEYSAIVPAFAGVLVGFIVFAFGAMARFG